MYYLVMGGREGVEASHDEAAAVHVFHEGEHAPLADAGEGHGEKLCVTGIPSYSADQRLKDVGPVN
jgi:hypothetical protein